MGKPANEFTFILVDTSDSMKEPTIIDTPEESKKKKGFFGRKDEGGGNLSRFEAAVDAAKTVVKTKKVIVDTDKYGIVMYSNASSTLLQELTNDHDQLVSVLSSLTLGVQPQAEKKGKIEGALALVIQEFAKQLKFVGNLMLRVLIFTDDMQRDGISDQEKRLVEIARDIGVYIDILYFGTDPDNKGVDEEADADGYFLEEEVATDPNLEFGLDSSIGEEPISADDMSYLEEQGLLIPGLTPAANPSGSAGHSHAPKKRKKHHRDIRLVAEMTDGLFLDGKQSIAEIQKHAKKLGDIKDLEEGLDAFEDAPVRKKKLISAIAEELVPLAIQEMQEISAGTLDLKCNICFSKELPFTLRRCSYCSREMHLTCVMKWAEQDTGKEESFIFRCPFCFHLLKVDPGLTKLMDLQTVRQNVAKAHEDDKPRETTAVVLSPDQILSVIEPCEVCEILLEDDQKVYQCTNCGAAYHDGCFQQTLESNENHCRRCGFLFSSW